MARDVNRQWLDSEIKWPLFDTCDLNLLRPSSAHEIEENEASPIPSTSTVQQTAEAGTSTKRSIRVPFSDLSNKQKKRRSGSVIEENTEEELQYYFTSKLKANGKSDLAKAIGHLCNNLEILPDITKFLFKQNTTTENRISDDKSLGLSTSLGLSKWKYLTLRNLLREESSTLLPSYQQLLLARKRCYPSDEYVDVTEAGAQIKLQGLLDHTAQRILQGLGPVTSSDNTTLKLIWKWGLDGSSSQSNYKQKSLDPPLKDSSVVMTSAVPLRLVDGGNLVIWQNPNPCSTFYCRPVKFSFIQESADYIKGEHSRMEQEISELIPTRCEDVEIAHEMHMTMIDGKVANIIADVPSAATCPICLAKPSDMNNLDLLTTKPIRDDMYRYGISSLHMKIRCMECLLHISYNMDFQRWSARGEHKILKEAKKAENRQQFREEIGVLIDIVKQGFGTTNDGNTARRFFNDYKKSSRITGIDENLMLRFAVILQVIASESKINIEKFQSYCKETAELYVHLYPWYYMPVSVHKLLIHGPEICKHFGALPIGTLSEEASESRNKDFRHVRERNSRKIGRVSTNEDILHGLLISSDPFLSRIRPKFSRKIDQTLFPEALSLLHSDSSESFFEEQEDFSMESEDIFDPLL